PSTTTACRAWPAPPRRGAPSWLGRLARAGVGDDLERAIAPVLAALQDLVVDDLVAMQEVEILEAHVRARQDEDAVEVGLAPQLLHDLDGDVTLPVRDDVAHHLPAFCHPASHQPRLH